MLEKTSDLLKFNIILALQEVEPHDSVKLSIKNMRFNVVQFKFKVKIIFFYLQQITKILECSKSKLFLNYGTHCFWLKIKKIIILENLNQNCSLQMFHRMNSLFKLFFF